MKKIFYVLENFYPQHRAGTETYVLNLARQMLKAGEKVFVVKAAVGQSSYSYNYEGIDVYAISVPQKISTAELNGLDRPSNLNEFVSLLQNHRPDIVHFHSFSRSFNHFHLKAAYDSQARVFMTIHLTGMICSRNDFLYLGQKQCDGKVRLWRCAFCYWRHRHNFLVSALGASLSVVVSKTPMKQLLPAINFIYFKKQSLFYLNNYTQKIFFLAKWLEPILRKNKLENIVYIPQAIDTNIFRRKEFKPIENLPIILLFVGRMVPNKGFHILLNALQIDNLYKSFRLNVITIQSSDAYYQQMKQNFCALYDQTSWYENLSQQQVAEIMQQSDVLVLPSLYEVAPLVILEAYAVGLFVVASDISSIKNVFVENTGILFKTNDSVSVYEALKKLIDKKFLSKKYWNYFPQSFFSFADIAAIYSKFYFD